MYDCDVTMDSQVTEEDMRDQKIDDITKEIRTIFGLGWRAGYEVGYADGYPAGMDQVVAQFGIDEAEVF